MNNFDLIVIGGGPAGIFASLTASQKSKKVLLIEKNKEVGKKLLVAGSGKCNITHEGKPKDFLTRYGNNGKFLKEALFKFTPENVCDFFKKEGLHLELVENTGKYFPHTYSSRDVVNLLTNILKREGVNLSYENEILEISHATDNEDFNFIIKVRDKENKVITYTSSNLLISTGGASFPGTGTTGDGYLYAKSLGHKIIPPRPSLTPVFVYNYPYTDLSGLSFKDINITYSREIDKNNFKKVIEHRGDVLFTHTNFSGPGVLDSSRYVEHDMYISFNYLNIEKNDLNKFFLETIESRGKMMVKSMMNLLDLPERFTKKIIEMANLKEDMKISELSRDAREALVNLLVDNKQKISKLGNLQVAMVTCGGVDLNEVNKKTMESKLVKGLYFAGEVLDIDGDTGGFNIQGAISMGVLVGNNIK